MKSTRIKDYPDYTIYEDGRIYSHKTNKFMKVQIANNGYYSLELTNDKGHKRIALHRLLAENFIPNPLNLPIINHKDENKLNNALDNLEWCTHQYNLTYGTCIKRRVEHTNYKKMNLKERCLKHNEECKRPVIQYDKVGNYIARYESGIAASKAFGKNHSHILECCKGKRYKTVYGYIWKYEKEG